MNLQSKRLACLAGLGAIAVLVLGAVVIQPPISYAAPTHSLAVPPARAQLQPSAAHGRAHAVLAGGCFWGMELVFSHVKGVTNVVSGYAGGEAEHANYADSSSGRYDDAEAVRISYDPAVVSFTELLQVYFSVAHDPTQINRQGPDVGPQYRSQIFALNAAQARVARAYIEQLDGAQVFNQPIATRVSVGDAFFPAESRHQDYAIEHPGSAYIRFNDLPKLRALEARYPARHSPHYADGSERRVVSGQPDASA